jgi:hypothetical protein
MKRLAIFFLAFSIFSVQADVGSRHSITDLVNDLKYSLTVDWNQEDADFHQQKMIEFKSAVERLYEEGHDHKVLINELISSLPDQRLAQDIKQALAMMELTKMSQTESHNVLTDIVSKHRSSGAEWAGTVALVSLGLIVVIIGTVLGLAFYSDGQSKYCKHERQCNGGNGCGWVYVCDK